MEAVCDHLLASGVKLPGVYGPAPISDGFARRWAAATRVTATPGFESRVFRMGEPVPPVGVPGHLRAATRADRELLIRWTNAFGTEAVPHEGLDGTEAIDTRLRHPGRLWTWVDDDRPVSMPWISPPGAGVVRVSAVYTPPQLRGRGYASACVAAVSARTMAEGHTCVLHTDINNRTSNKIYQEIGYRPIMDLRDWTFAGR
jgi:predicted GNAT family acetyltransferase